MTYHPLSFEIIKRFFPDGKRLDSLFRQVFREKKVKPQEKKQIYDEVTGFIRLFPAWLADEFPEMDLADTDWVTVLKAIRSFDWQSHQARLLALPADTPVTHEILRQFGLPALFRSWIGESVPDRDVLKFLKKSIRQKPVYLREIGKIEKPDRDLLPVEGFQGAWKYTASVLDFADDWFQSGQFEIQDLSGQIAAMLANPKPNDKIMDACAGHGGKTMTLASLMKGKGKIVTVHVSEQELQTLKLRARKHQLGNIVSVMLDSPDLESVKNSLDIVWVDAPCSGSGVIRRNPEVVYRLNETVIQKMEEEQSILINHYFQFVKPGGRLVYSTCSVFSAENEAVIQDFISGNENQTGFASLQSGISYFNLPVPDTNPQRMGFSDSPDTDGFFLAVLTKKA